jgi:hypothetical protein
MRHAHSTKIKSYPCQSQQCDKVFKRGDARLKHERKHYPELDRQPAEKRLWSRSGAVLSSAERNHSSPWTVEAPSKEDQNGTSQLTNVLLNTVVSHFKDKLKTDGQLSGYGYYPLL